MNTLLVDLGIFETITQNIEVLGILEETFSQEIETVVIKIKTNEKY